MEKTMRQLRHQNYWKNWQTQESVVKSINKCWYYNKLQIIERMYFFFFFHKQLLLYNLIAEF